jgi:iron complex transport system ATP-binding protein
MELAPVLEARGLRVEAGGKTILSGIDLTVAPGKVTVLLGPNGAGKSTLLGVFAGGVKPVAGGVWMNGRLLSAHAPVESARARAVLLQDFHLPFAFTVEEVALMGRHPHVRGRESARDLSIVDECLQAADMLPLRERLYPTLSGGERQRTHWARILAQLDPSSGLERKCVLLDEPTSSLDLAHQHALLESARGLARGGAAVLVVLHDLNLAAHYGDILVLIQQGRVRASGSPSEVLTAPRLREVYGVDARVAEHPDTGRPWVLVRPAGSRPLDSRGLTEKILETPHQPVPALTAEYQRRIP